MRVNITRQVRLDETEAFTFSALTAYGLNRVEIRVMEITRDGDSERFRAKGPRLLKGGKIALTWTEVVVETKDIHGWPNAVLDAINYTKPAVCAGCFHEITQRSDHAPGCPTGQNGSPRYE